MNDSSEKTKLTDSAYDEPAHAIGSSKHQNALLVRPRIGQGPVSSMALPPTDHAYGFSTKKRDAGAQGALSGWVESKPPKQPQLGKDFVKLNRLAMKSGVMTSGQLTEFRKNHDVRIVDKKAQAANRPPSAPFQKVPPGGFGQKSAGREESMSSVITGFYGRKAIATQKEHVEQTQRKKKHPKPKATKASTLKAQSAMAAKKRAEGNDLPGTKATFPIKSKLSSRMVSRQASGASQRSSHSHSQNLNQDEEGPAMFDIPAKNGNEEKEEQDVKSTRSFSTTSGVSI